MIMTKKVKKGFTLVELLVVIAIIGILAAVGITALSGARSKARDAKRVADIKQVQSALELYFNDKAGYPAAATALALGSSSASILCSGETTTGFLGTMCTGAPTATYMGLVPKDPQSTGTACVVAGDPPAIAGPCDYAYTSTDVNSYQIYFWLEAPTAGFDAGANCASQNGIRSGVTCP